jgi:hypothetical protein
MDGFQPIYIPGPTDAPGNTEGLGGGSVAQPSNSILPTAAGVAATAALTPFLGPFAPIGGSLIGSLFGGGKGSPAGGSTGLPEALGLGLGSLFSSKSSNVSTQTQNVGQNTNVDVNNVLGGRPFGNYDAATGSFDDYQAISDVYAIKAAQDQARLAQSASVTPAPIVQETKKALNFLPLIVAGGLALTFVILRRK